PVRQTEIYRGILMELKTLRLYIRDLREDDWLKMKSLFIDFNNSKYAAYDRPLPTEDAEIEALTKQFVENSLFFAIYLLDKNQMIGYVCFHKEEEKYDLGYCFHSTYHSKGYAYESIKALIEYFVREYNAITFTAGTALANIPSCKLLEKLGFECVSTEEISFNEDFSFEGGNFILNLQ
ncbi:MAG: GNAT family N-acetyltransferase, partial [Lachnospiraceae bacterium]|nr:GNAT family N-acetyltransferase [Lachnospiraceae bacterium]